MPVKDPRVYLSYYKSYPFRVNYVKLHFDVLSSTEVVVRSRIEFEASHPNLYEPFLELHGSSKLRIKSLTIDEVPTKYDFDYEDEILRIPSPPLKRPFVFRAEVVIDPASNTACSGLYQTGNILISQCEAEGFRNITFYPDRPDVLATFEVSLEAAVSAYPVVLANGNQVAETTGLDGRRVVTFHDPFLKPSYLFCVVLGNLKAREAFFDCGLTRKGQKVRVALWTKPDDWKKSEFGLNCVLKAMRWDEAAFGRVYDLDEYHIVGVDDFVFGAMENKGLNVFSSSYILADSETTHDTRFADIDATIAHEYFHNWTGNRVTLNSFFQISLKEGLTTFREQEYCKAMHGRAQAALNHARYMQSSQFLEESGQMATPMIPPFYEAVDNLYTATVYQKAAEVVRMLGRVLGADAFRMGFDLFFDRHDGQAVTVKDFVKAIGDASETDLSSFMLWYYQAGTPVVSVAHSVPKDSSDSFTVCLSQRLPETAGDPEGQVKQPMPIPVAIALFDAAGNKITAAKVMSAGNLYLNGCVSDCVLLLNEASTDFTFTCVSAPVHAVSVLRDFSAPVIIDYPQQSTADLLFLLKHEDDAFARFQAAKTVVERTLRAVAEAGRTAVSFAPEFDEAVAALIEDERTDPGLKAAILSSVPSVNELACFFGEGKYSPMFLHELRCNANASIARANEAQLYTAYKAAEDAAKGQQYDFSVNQVSQRAFKNACLHLLVESLNDVSLGVSAFEYATNFTDRIEAMNALNDKDDERHNQVLAAFLDRYRDDTLVLRSYCRVVARSNVANNCERIQKLMENSAVYNQLNPESIRGVLCGLASSPVNFHHVSGEGYRFIAENVKKVNAVNPTVAAQVLDMAFSDWLLWDEATQSRIRPVLQELFEDKTLEKQVREVLKRALAGYL